MVGLEDRGDRSEAAAAPASPCNFIAQEGLTPPEWKAAFCQLKGAELLFLHTPGSSKGWKEPGRSSQCHLCDEPASGVGQGKLYLYFFFQRASNGGKK